MPSVENTHFVIDGVDVDLESLASATNSSFDINGYDINLDGLTNVDGTTFLVSGQVEIDLPGVIEVTQHQS